MSLIRKTKTILSRARKGFTLLELLVVIAIIGILSSVAVVSFNSARGKARDAKRIADASSVSKAIAIYFDDQGAYPPLGAVAKDKALCSGGAALTTCLAAEITYMGKIPGNPTPGGQDYVYELVGTTDYSWTFKLENPNASIGATLAGATCVADSKGVHCP